MTTSPEAAKAGGLGHTTHCDRKAYFGQVDAGLSLWWLAPDMPVLGSPPVQHGMQNLTRQTGAGQFASLRNSARTYDLNAALYIVLASATISASM